MGQDSRQRRRGEGDAGGEAGAERSGAPGRRTLTMGLSGGPRGTGPLAQLARDGGGRGDHGDHGDRAAELAWLFDLAVRPDLYAPVQRRAAPATAVEAAPAPSGGGQPLEPGVRIDMERAFGADFSAVRIHEGDQAPAVGALAYTQGADIHFAPGQYAPAADAGRNLLGHELAHVVQQAEGCPTSRGPDRSTNSSRPAMSASRSSATSRSRGA